jgi:prepilin signal peptidase PulO-like enzyme (type II secretory pathway)
MKELKQIDMTSAAKVFGIFYFLISLIVFVPIVLVLSIFDISTGLANIGVFTALLIPLLYGFIGMVGAFLASFVYNVIASKVGGIKMKVSEETEGDYD